MAAAATQAGAAGLATAAAATAAVEEAWGVRERQGEAEKGLHTLV